MKDLLKMTLKDLNKELQNSRKELLKLKFVAKVGKLNAPHKMRELKKQIARISTVITGKGSSKE